MNKGLVTMSITGWKSRISGVIIAESSEWVILNVNPVDYVLDGFVIVIKKYIESIDNNKDNVFKFKVIKSCDKIKSTKLVLAEQENMSSLIKQIGKLYGLISISKSLDDEIYVGIFEKIRNGKISLKSVKTNGKIGSIESFDFDSVRAIEFDTDYLYSLGCYMKAIM